jgi:hypothetical protein
VTLNRDGLEPADARLEFDRCGPALFAEPAPAVLRAPVCMTFAAPSVQFQCGPVSPAGPSLQHTG